MHNIKGYDLEKIYHFLLLGLAFFLPLTVFVANFIIVIVCLLWIISGEYKSKLNEIIKNKLMIASIIFFLIHLLGLIWTEDLNWGFHILHKMWYFIGLFPILYTIVRKKHVSVYVTSFLLAISLTEVLSYLVWFELIDPFKNATIYNPTPFMSHISYNPILAIAIYIVGHEILFSLKTNPFKRFLYSFFLLSMTINMFITGGRAGQVMFFAVVSILIFQYFNTQKFKAILLIVIVTSSIFFTAFQTSTIFQYRAMDVIHNIKDYHENKNTSVGHRISFTLNSWEIIKKNPLIGVGTGDFPFEYSLINKINTPELDSATNPHNMYVLILCQLGVIGLISLLSIFYYQIKLSFLSTSQFNRNFGLALPLLFLLIMFSDSYLLGHFTTLLYIFFSSFLYKDFENS